jgi:hypothetical protein
MAFPESGLEARVAHEVDIEPADPIEADNAVELVPVPEGLYEAFDVPDGPVIGACPEINKFNLHSVVPGAFPHAREDGDIVSGLRTGAGEPAHIPLEASKLEIPFYHKGQIAFCRFRAVFFFHSLFTLNSSASRTDCTVTDRDVPHVPAQLCYCVIFPNYVSGRVRVSRPAQ